MNHHTPPAITLALLLCLPAAAQQKAPPAMELVSPVPSGEQKGVIEVRIRTGVVGKPPPSSVYASLGGSPGVRLTRSGDSDEWGCQIDTTRTPNGGQQLRVITENKSVLAVPLTVNNPLRHYFADLHSHTSFSDGTLLPESAHDYARNVAKLDVFSLTDHLEAVDAGEWNRTQEVAWRASGPTTRTATWRAFHDESGHNTIPLPVDRKGCWGKRLLPFSVSAFKILRFYPIPPFPRHPVRPPALLGRA
jgi:hypothetical protein